jgi:hypothetical protein
MMGIWFILLVPFFILMMVLGNQRRNEEEDEEVGSGTYRGEEEEEEEEDEHEGGGKITKEDQTPLWKYVTRLGRGIGGGTTKFVWPHCNTTYTGSYTYVRKHLRGVIPWDENKTIGVKTLGQCQQKIDPNIRGKRRKHNTNPKNQGLNKRSQAHINHLELTPRPPMVVDLDPCIMGVKHYQTSLTLVVGMMWMQMCSGSSMHVVYHSMFFAHCIGMK